MTRTSAEPAGMHCPEGGKKIERGLDLNSNGVLDASEVNARSYVCASSSKLQNQLQDQDSGQPDSGKALVKTSPATPTPAIPTIHTKKSLPSGIELSFRTGFAVAFGDITAASGDSMSDYTQSAMPVWFDAGYRFALPNLFIGMYAQYAVGNLAGTTANACNNRCSADLIKFGFQAQLRTRPDSIFDPWLGLGIGGEFQSLSGPGGTSRISGVSYMFQVGGDFHITRYFGLGPFVIFDFGEYSTFTIVSGAKSSSGSITNTSFHEWLTFGIRGVFDVAL